MHRKNIETQTLFSRSCTCTPMNILSYHLYQCTVSTPVHKIHPNIREFASPSDPLLRLIYHYEIAGTQFLVAEVEISDQEIYFII